MDNKGSYTLYYIKELLKEKGLTSKALAEALGVTTVTVSYIINGKTNPSLETVSRIAEVLGVPVWRLFASPEEVKNEMATTSPSLTCPVCGARLRLTEDVPQE